jgi:hypothetical protein
MFNKAITCTLKDLIRLDSRARSRLVSSGDASTHVRQFEEVQWDSAICLARRGIISCIKSTRGASQGTRPSSKSVKCSEWHVIVSLPVSYRFRRQDASMRRDPRVARRGIISCNKSTRELLKGRVPSSLHTGVQESTVESKIDKQQRMARDRKPSG